MKKYAANFKNLAPHFYKWANRRECVLSLSAVHTLADYGFSLNDVKKWNAAAIAGNKRGLAALIAATCPRAALSFSNLGKHGKTYQLRVVSGGKIVRDTAIFLESQLC